MESAERLEVAVRTVICNLLSLKYSPHWYLKSEIFAPKGRVGLGQEASYLGSGRVFGAFEEQRRSNDHGIQR